MGAIRECQIAMEMNVRRGYMTRGEADAIFQRFQSQIIEGIAKDKRQYYDVECIACGTKTTVMGNVSVWYCRCEKNERPVWDTRIVAGNPQ